VYFGKEETELAATLQKRKASIKQTLTAKRLSTKGTAHIKKRGFNTFKSIRESFTEDVSNLHRQFADIPLNLVEGIITYCRCLSSDEVDYIIEQNVFDAVMSKRFNLTAKSMLERMFIVASKGVRPPVKMTVMDLAELILLFLCSQNFIKEKADYVFSVYDINNRGCLTKSDLRSVLAPMLVDVSLGDDVDDDEDLVGSFVDLVEARIDANKDSVIELHEFQDLVKKDSMWLQFLGPCLPLDEDTKIFRDMFQDLTIFEVQAKFRSELRFLLHTPEPRLSGTFNGLYPFRLELL